MADWSREARVRYALGGLHGLKIAGEDMLGESQRRAPIEEGTLRASAELVFVVNDRVYDGPGAYEAARGAIVALARSGTLQTVAARVQFTEIYAAYQHQRDDLVHQRGGQAFYLQSVLQERGARYVHAAGLAAERGLD